eukprot:scaffold4420_cov187-Amphora_coffeaeformis.AAC.23
MAITTEAPQEETTVLPKTRQEASSSEHQGELVWTEHFVDVPKASLTTSVGSALAQALTYICIPNFATPEECMALQESALAQRGEKPHVMAASQVNFNCTRYSVETMLDQVAKDTSAAFLARLLDLIEHDKELRQIFPAGRDNNVPISQLRVTWYAEPDSEGVLQPEPKVNIYQEGGFFKQHTDGMQLTLLVILNDGYEGGGTAFFADQEETSSEYVAVRPSAGTAAIWGGDLLHMALPVRKGMRAVYVGSFDLDHDEV